MSFTDQQPHVATEADCAASWGGKRHGAGFRCYLCGHRFVAGDTYRWVSAASRRRMNFLVCTACDGADVLDRWEAAQAEVEQRFWWVLPCA